MCYRKVKTSLNISHSCSFDKVLRFRWREGGELYLTASSLRLRTAASKSYRLLAGILLMSYDSVPRMRYTKCAAHGRVRTAPQPGAFEGFTRRQNYARAADRSGSGRLVLFGRVLVLSRWLSGAGPSRCRHDSDDHGLVVSVGASP
jgi:hypothetical protein